jgi:AAA+ superfamily predicted ATPase
VNQTSLYHIQTSLRRIDVLIEAAVVRAQQSSHGPADALRGLVVSDGEVAQLLQNGPMMGLWGDHDDVNLSLLAPDGRDPDLPFLALIDNFDLQPLDAYILLLCLAPDLDRRYERVFAYLQDDMSQRRVTINLLMNLLGGSLEQRFEVWGRLQRGTPLIDHRLVILQPNPDKPNAASLGHVAGVENRLIAHLLGDDTPDTRVSAALRPTPDDVTVGLPSETYQHLENLLPASPVIYMKGAAGYGQVSTAAALCAPYNLPLVRIDATALKGEDAVHRNLWRVALREAYFARAALVIENWESALGSNKQPDAELWNAILAYPRPVFLCGEEDWEPTDPSRVRPMLRVTFEVPSAPERRSAWVDYTTASEIDVDPHTLEGLAQKFRLSRTQIARAVRTAGDVAASRGGSVGGEDLYAGVQAQISLSLGHLAQRIEPRFTWDELILPPDPLRQLHEITDRLRFAHRVQDEWAFRRRIANATGVSVLFAGESGTGKTLAVQVIARELGLVLYRIDLSAVVSKYIGETEKNLSVIFKEARSSNAILFFDEADAIFGKRSEVKDARDRYANIEVAYLLQEIEEYDGLAIMATNLRQNLDEAFTRRLDFVVDFPFPDETYRERLWQAHFPPEAPLGADVDLTSLAYTYHLAGGNIRNAALASAYLAAADGGVITQEHIRNAVRREHQKMGRLLEELS